MTPIYQCHVCGAIYDSGKPAKCKICESININVLKRRRTRADMIRTMNDVDLHHEIVNIHLKMQYVDTFNLAEYLREEIERRQDMKRKVHYRWKNSWIDLCNDGMSRYERVKGKVKKILQRDTRRKLKNTINTDAGDE